MREELPSLRHFFKRLWLICIGAAALLLLSFVVMESIETHLEQRRGGVVVAVNLLGRQRMHSQMLVRLAMQSEHRQD